VQPIRDLVREMMTEFVDAAERVSALIEE